MKLIISTIAVIAAVNAVDLGNASIEMQCAAQTKRFKCNHLEKTKHKEGPCAWSKAFKTCKPNDFDKNWDIESGSCEDIKSGKFCKKYKDSCKWNKKTGCVTKSSDASQSCPNLSRSKCKRDTSCKLKKGVSDGKGGKTFKCVAKVKPTLPPTTPAPTTPAPTAPPLKAAGEKCKWGDECQSDECLWLPNINDTFDDYGYCSDYKCHWSYDYHCANCSQDACVKCYDVSDYYKATLSGGKCNFPIKQSWSLAIGDECMEHDECDSWNCAYGYCAAGSSSSSSYSPGTSSTSEYWG